MSGIGGTTSAGIAASVRDLVGMGRLNAGDALPPIRSLAQELGVNRNTVATAYRLLVAAGVAETHGRGGTAIATVPDVDRDGASLRRELVDLASGNPDPRLLPDVVQYVSGYETSLYGAPAEHGPLAAWARERLAEDVPQTFDVVVTHGAVDAIERLLAVHLTRGDAVAVEDPVLSGAHQHAAPERLRRRAGRGRRLRHVRARARAGAGGRSARGHLHAACAEPDRRERDAGARRGVARRPGPPPARPGHRGRPLLGALGRRLPPDHARRDAALGARALRGQVPRARSARGGRGGRRADRGPAARAARARPRRG